jgi:hypothetical protein
VLLLVRSMLGLEPDAVTGDLRLTRPSMAGVPDMTIDRLHIAGRRARVSVLDGSGTVRSG